MSFIERVSLIRKSFFRDSAIYLPKLNNFAVHMHIINYFQVDVFFWSPVQLVNFYFVPITLRLIYSNSACLVWAIALSTLKHNVSQSVGLNFELLYLKQLIPAQLEHFE